MGNALNQAQEFEEAEAYYMQVLEHPMSTVAYDAMLGMASLAQQRGDGAAALSWYEKGANHNPYRWEAFVGASRTRMRSGDVPGARRLIERALLFNPAEPALVRELDSVGR